MKGLGLKLNEVRNTAFCLPAIDSSTPLECPTVYTDRLWGGPSHTTSECVCD